MPLFSTTTVDAELVARVLQEQWGLKLGKVLKASQNHTFEAVNEATSQRYAVRVTPDEENAHYQRICDEITFVTYLVSQGLKGVCAPIPATDGSYVVRSSPVTIVVFTWAEGEPVDFMAYKWMTNLEIVKAWGAWIARLHAVSRKFGVERAEVASRMRRWDEIHEGIMKGAFVSEEDEKISQDALGGPHYGVLHGDCNLSNFYVVTTGEGSEVQYSLSVFDWDQVHLGWYEADLAQAMLSCTMLAEGGSIPAGDKVPEADPPTFQAAMVEGYESVAGPGSVDRARLKRMNDMRKVFYNRFCVRAKEEGVPPDMGWFIDYVLRWMDKIAFKEATA